VTTKRAIVIVAPTFESAFAAELQRHLLDLAGSIGEWCDIEPLTDDPGVQTTRLLSIRRRVSPKALVAISVRPTADVIAAYRAAGAPVVLLDEEAPGAASVSTDNEVGGYLAGKHLLLTGRKFLSVITGRVNAPGGMNARLRLAGFRRALAEVRLTPTVHIEVDYSRRDGEECFLRAQEHADGVFCAAGDTCAIGLIAGARARKVRVPEDFAIVGYDNLPLAEIWGLTTIRQPFAEMAEAAYRMTVVEPSQTLASPQKRVFTPKPIIRGSTAELTTETKKAS
jgi:LacI family transcriptional regulator